jgi:hypothetical protein
MRHYIWLEARLIFVVDILKTTNMKNLTLKKIKNSREFFIGILLVLLVVVVGYNSKLSSQNLFNKANSSVKSKIRYLEMTGTVKEAKNWQHRKLKNIENAKIAIFNKEHKVIKLLYSNKKGQCIIKLPLDKEYILEVSKNGWVTKTINVDTRLRIKKLNKYVLNYEIEMFEDISGLDVAVLHKPIAHVKYNNYLKSFDYDFLYTDLVNAKLKNNYLAYYKLHPERKTSPNNKTNNTKRIRYTPQNISQPTTTTNKKVISSDKKGPNERSEQFNIKQADSDYNYQTNDARKNSIEVNSNKSTVKMDSANIMFKVEILALNGHLTLNKEFFKKYGNVNEYIDNGKYKYTIGEFKSFETASKMLNEINNSGYKDAFLVAFFKSQKITMEEALVIKSPK